MDEHARDTTRGVVRLVAHGPQGPAFGSGVFITPFSVLTARHVVDPSMGSVAGACPPARQVRVEGMAVKAASVVVDELRFPDDPDIDLAMAILHSPKGSDPSHVVRVVEAGVRAVNIGDEVEIAGYQLIDGAAERERVTLNGVHPDAGAFIVDKALPRGFSGGPVLANGLLIGVSFARDHGQGRSYVQAGTALQRFVAEAAIGDVLVGDGGFSGLRRFPLGPAMAPAEATALLADFIQKLIQLVPPGEAARLVDRANLLRLECGPDNGLRSRIERYELPSPNFDYAGFWYGAFAQASAKSPRMLAALLTAIDDEPFAAGERQQKQRVLARLERIGATEGRNDR